MLLTLLALNCLADIKAHEQDLADYLPGNRSSIQFTRCIGESTTGGGVVDGEGNWKISQVNAAGTMWSYSGKVYTHIDVDENCKVKAVDVWTKPSNWLLEPVLEKAEDVIWEKFDDLLRERPEYLVICGKAAS